MSYDYMMLKPVGVLRTPDEIGPDRVDSQDPGQVVAELDRLFAAIAWSREADGGWFGTVTVDGDRFEFRVSGAVTVAWSVFTSHRADRRRIATTVGRICTALGVVAFDGQAMVLIGGAAVAG
jgi:hypothetical protein